MAMLAFMPWCRLDRAYGLGEVVELLPFDRDRQSSSIDEGTHSQISAISSIYKHVDGTPVARLTLARFAAKSITADLEDSEVETLMDLISIACFCALARRQYFRQLGDYVSADCFALYVQRFSTLDFVTLRSRRRDGATWDTWPLSAVAISEPVQCHTVREVVLDLELLKGLASQRVALSPPEWGRWLSSISCFNRANTDGEGVQPQIEWVLMCGAFEHLLDAASNAIDVANKFTNALAPSAKGPQAACARLAGKPGSHPVRWEWMREFYRIRGDFAHGRINTRQPMVWAPAEHLLLAAIAFPLLVKSLLAEAARYALTDGDQAQIDCLETFACERHMFGDPSQPTLAGRYRWDEMVRSEEMRIVSRRAKTSFLLRGQADDKSEDPDTEADR